MNQAWHCVSAVLGCPLSMGLKFPSSDTELLHTSVVFSHISGNAVSVSGAGFWLFPALGCSFSIDGKEVTEEMA